MTLPCRKPAHPGEACDARVRPRIARFPAPPPHLRWQTARIAPGRVTSTDVAQRAGVSQSAVSLVLSGKGQGRVSPAKAEAIRRAAKELGYRPNAAARQLRTGLAQAVGLVVPDVMHPFFGGLLRGAQDAAKAGGQAVVLVDAGYDEDWEQTSYDLLSAGGVDGFLWFATKPPREARDAAPLVLIEAEVRGVTSIRWDVGTGCRLVGEHLQALGHRRVVRLAATADQQTFALRGPGYEAGLGRPLQSVVRARFGLESAREAARTALDVARTKRPTALVADDDLLAAGAVLAARDLGLSVPGDLSVAGFDDLDLAKVLDPPLTTVRLDTRGLGAAALTTLNRLIAGEEVPRRQVLPVELVVRGSTAAPRR